MPTSSSPQPVPVVPAAGSPRFLPGLAPAILGALVLIAAYRSNLTELVRTWWNEPDYSHGFLVIPVALIIAWRGVGRGVVPRPWPPGLALLGAVLAARAACFQAGEFWYETATIIPAVAALVLALGGRALLRRTWPAVLFLTFMLTIPKALDALISQPLQRIAAATSGAVLRLGGLWVLNEGNLLDLGDERLEVATACNGLAMLMSLSFTVAAIILLVPMARWKRVGVLLSALPIALACNVLRIAATAYCYEAFGSAAGRKFAHDAAGFLMMPLALALIGLQVAWFSWLIRPGTPAPSPAPLSALPGISPIR